DTDEGRDLFVPWPRCALQLLAHIAPCAALAATSVRYVLPSKSMRAQASYARSRASRRVAPSAVTVRTLPPAVTTLSSRATVPEWNTSILSIRPAASRPEISRPVSYGPGYPSEASTTPTHASGVQVSS